MAPRHRRERAKEILPLPQGHLINKEKQEKSSCLALLGSFGSLSIGRLMRDISGV